MIFKKENGKYYINNYEVNLETYASMATEQLEKVQGSDNITVTSLKSTQECYNDCNCDRDCGENCQCGNIEPCICEECEELLDIVYTLEELDDKDSVEFLRDILDNTREKAFAMGMKEVYDNVGNEFLKISNKIKEDFDDEDKCCG